MHGANTVPMSTWVLLRGLTRESRHWGSFPAALDAALGGAPILALDLPGNGRLQAERSPASAEAMAAWCRDELRRRGLAPPYRLLAMSLGAMVAVAWASRHPQELAGCVLVNTSLRPFSPFYRRLRPAAYPSLLWLALARPRAERHEGVVLRLTTRHAPASEAVLRDWVALHRECSVTRGNALRQLIAAARFSAPQAAPATPLLVLAGARDALVDVSCSRQLAAAWQVPLAVHPSAGHDLPLDDAPWVAEQVRRWLAG